MHSARRHGMTLIELLVVISILVILIAVAIPIMRPALKDRKVREASRMINTQFAVAKAKAAQTGRPHGVWLVRDSNNVNACVQLYIAESPMPFSGDMIGTGAGTGAIVTYDANANGNTPAGYGNVAVFADVQNLVQVGDYIQFNFKGPKYLITGIPQPSPKKVIFRPLSGSPWPKLAGLPGDQTQQTQMQFQVYRRPIKSSMPPLQLPTGAVIDLAYSGLGLTGNEMINTNTNLWGNSDIQIMFSPSGALDPMTYPVADAVLPTTIHLLVGRTDQTPALEPQTIKSNLADGSTSWVSIGAQTGTVTTNENYVLNASSIDTGTGLQNTLAGCRSLAQKKQTMGGR